MAYKWKPSASQKRAFAEKMKDDKHAGAYNERKAQKALKRRKTSKYDYNTAGGQYIPTTAQNEAAFKMLQKDASQEQKEAANMILYGYSCNEKIHHDYIHVVNEYIRSNY